MTTSAGWALQRGLYQALASDAELIFALGGARIYDNAPQRGEFPYLTIGQSVMRDWSTGTEDGAEHLVTLHVWSRASGKRQAFEIMASVEQALHDRDLALAGHALVNLRHVFSDARLDPDGETYHGIVRFRAVTEALPAAA
jgi:hypothetical protein